MKHTPKRRQRGWWQYAAAAAAALGSYLGNKGQKEANATNLQLGREQMDFQREMSNTAYQRQTADLKAAGLNPMLSFSNGGASTPAGSLPQVQNEIGPAMSSASQTLNMIGGLQQIEQSKAQTAKLQAETKQVESTTYDHALNVNAREVSIEKNKQSASLDFQRQLTEAQRLGLIKNQAEYTKIMEQLRSIEMDRSNTTFADDVALRRAQRILTELDIPRSQNAAKFEQTAGEYNPWIKQLLDVLKLLNPTPRR